MTWIYHQNNVTFAPGDVSTTCSHSLIHHFFSYLTWYFEFTDTIDIIPLYRYICIQYDKSVWQRYTDLCWWSDSCLVFQGAIGPDGPTGEMGLKGKAVRNLHILFHLDKIKQCKHETTTREWHLTLQHWYPLACINFFWHVLTHFSLLFLSLQGSDGPPGKLGFPGPQVKHWGTVMLFLYFLPYIFISSSGETSIWMIQSI